MCNFLHMYNFSRNWTFGGSQPVNVSILSDEFQALLN